jgi:excinuclease ABC subunit A
MKEELIIKGARQHNLKNIDVVIPRNKMVVITGLSGSGKSSLAFDTIYAEGQRRYVESLSSYARQFLGQMDKPDVDYIEGLSPAISIDQKTTSRNPRSTVGTVTEIYDYLRLLFARIGIPHCPHCGIVIEKQSVEQITDSVLELAEGTKFMVMSPIVRARKGEHRKILENLRKSGYVRVMVDGEIKTLDEEINLDKRKKHDISVVIDRLVVREKITQRLAESIETALKLAEGYVEISVVGGETNIYSEFFACGKCGFSMPEIEPKLFSFNSPHGACLLCMGLGKKMELDIDLIIPDKTKTFAEGAIAAVSLNMKSYFMCQLKAILDKYGYSMDTAWNKLPEKIRKIILYGDGTNKISFSYENLRGETRIHNIEYVGILAMLNRRHKEAMSEAMRLDVENYMSSTPCPACHGTRLKPEVLHILVGGKNISEVTAYPVHKALNFFENLILTKRESIIASQVLKEIIERLKFLNNVGLDYLSLDRASGTLSGGEAQRIRLATQIGSGLVGVLYILDEPSIGLHQRDNDKLLGTLKYLKSLGNTLLIVEHDEDTMYAADEIIDIGPGAGENGGEIVAQGNVEMIKKSEKSITGQYLSGRKFIPVPSTRRKGNGKFIEIKGAEENNLKKINVKIPLGVLTVVTGVSGSGKSTLVNDILHNAIAIKLNKSKLRSGKYKAINGIENIDKIINIDQSPIGRTPRSNPATYTGVFTYIRELFSVTNESKIRGYKPGRFSFNVKGGRCEACSGDGVNKIEMHFLPDVYVPCDVCKGARYNRETLEVHYKGKNIAQVLDMTVSEATEFFSNIPKIYKKLLVVEDVGLGYIRLGQAATTLSGGEAQRVKLATELSKRSTGKTLYILDEPTTGLHTADVHKLLEVLKRLVDGGDSVVVIEHNLDVIKTADYIIDLGPEGGDKGGSVVGVGTPEAITKIKKSYTGIYLKKVLEQAKANGWVN